MTIQKKLSSSTFRGVARISKRWGHTVSQPGYLNNPLQMFGPENEVRNYLAPEKIYGIRFFGFARFRRLNYKLCMLFT